MGIPGACLLHSTQLRQPAMPCWCAGSAGGHTLVAGATRARVSTAQEAQALMRRAKGARAVEATAMNAESSRSHSVFMLHISGRHAASDTCLHGALNLVDLAGR